MSKEIFIAVVNLMPNKEETRRQWERLLLNSSHSVKLDFLQMETHVSKGTCKEAQHSYLMPKDIRKRKYDGMIITGAPVEKQDFSQVDYWEELVELFEYAKQNVRSTIFICWAAQAALYHYHQIEKQVYKEKIFGVFDNRIVRENSLVKGFDDIISMPQSRYAGNCFEEILKNRKLQVVAYSEESQGYILSESENNRVYISGHPEYEFNTLDREYHRDRKKGLSVGIPSNYYRNDNVDNEIIARWKTHSSLFFHNWLDDISKTIGGETGKKKKVVSKFGGTSLADAGQCGKVKEIVCHENCQNVVVSAPGKRNDKDEKITDLLCECCETENAKPVVEKIRQRFLAMCSELGSSKEVVWQVEQVMEKILHSENRDYIISRGEYLSGIIMAEYLGYDFVDAKDIIFFDEMGSLDEYRTFSAIRSKLEGEKKLVIPGFYGSAYSGGIKTFDRGGSDITGSLLARGLEAEVYQNWSDVDGVMTADPKEDKTATVIGRMSYEELYSMAEQGAKVYHPDAVKYIKEAGIPLLIKNTNEPQKKGTLVS